MRSKFPGYYKPTEKEFEKLWQKGLFVLDTNVLLDLFRYSDEAVESLIETITALKERIWIPYQVSLEYHRKLNDVIGAQISSYKKTIDTLEDFKKQLDAKRSHPFLDKKLHEEIQAFCLKFDDELIKKRDKVELLITENPIKEKIAELLDDRVGEIFDQKQLDDICSAGEKRYELRQPPGYMDCKDKKGLERYGDLIIWKEILQKSKKEKLNVILITGDVKEDWFLKHTGKTIGPRPELVQEFRDETNNLFYMYATNQFLKLSNKYLDQDIKDEFINEVKNVLSFELENSKTSNTSNEGFNDSNSTLDLMNNSHSDKNSSHIEISKIDNNLSGSTF